MSGKKKSKSVAQAPTPPQSFTPLAKLPLLAGDEVALEDGALLTCIGPLAGGMAFRAKGANCFTWPPADTMMRVLRSPNRERKVDEGREVDPLKAGEPPKTLT